jgi:hypothetical protein
MKTYHLLGVLKENVKTVFSMAFFDPKKQAKKSAL